MKILITNDDGIYADGIYELTKEISKEHEVILVAPLEQRSAFSHSITIENPIEIKKISLDGLDVVSYGITGTPADCVRVALDKLITDKVDMVISGINRGLNIGADIIYSGTVSAAIEASMYKIPSIAISQEVKNNKISYETAAKAALKVLSKFSKNLSTNNIVLNVNVPAIDESKIKGIKVCKLGDKVYNNFFIENNSQNGEISLLLQGTISEETNRDTDRYFLNKGYITLTPLHYDLTNYNILKEVGGWI